MESGVERVSISCGVEVGQLLPSKFGPGGASRCIQHPMVVDRLLSPIEFTALGGKQSSWKQAIRLDGGKTIQTLLEQKVLNLCGRDCKCKNCKTSREQPTDLNFLVDTVYSGKDPSSITSREGSRSRRSSGSKAANGQRFKNGAKGQSKPPVNGLNKHPETTKKQEGPVLPSFSSVPGVEPALPDEFCPSPDSSPGKVTEKPAESPLARVPPPQPASAGGSSLPGSPAAGGSKKRQQQDIRNFFTPSPSAPGGNGVTEGTPTNGGVTKKWKKKRSADLSSQLLDEKDHNSDMASLQTLRSRDQGKKQQNNKQAKKFRQPENKEKDEKQQETQKTVKIKREAAQVEQSKQHKQEKATKQVNTVPKRKQLQKKDHEKEKFQEKQQKKVAEKKPLDHKHTPEQVKQEPKEQELEEQQQAALLEKKEHLSKKSITPVRIRFEAGELQRIKSIDEDDIRNLQQAGQGSLPAEANGPPDDLDEIPLLVIHPERVKAKRQLVPATSPVGQRASATTTTLGTELVKSSTSSTEPDNIRNKDGDAAVHNRDLNATCLGEQNPPTVGTSVAELTNGTAGKRRPADDEGQMNGAPAKRSKPAEAKLVKVQPASEKKAEPSPHKVAAEPAAGPSKVTIKEEPREEAVSCSSGSSGGVEGAAVLPLVRLPTYTHMIKQALSEMNSVGGPGCTKLEILLYILQRFKPRESITHVTNMLFKVLEQGLKKGAFLSSASCTPRKLQQPTATTAGGDSKKVASKKSPAGGDPKKVTATKKLPFKIKEEPSTSAKEKNKPTDPEKPNTSKTEEKKKEIGVTPKRLLEPLASICKAKRLGRKAALKKVWCYIKAKKLLDPNDKSRILCDEKLRKLTKSKAISTKALCGFLKDFMVPIKS